MFGHQSFIIFYFPMDDESDDNFNELEEDYYAFLNVGRTVRV